MTTTIITSSGSFVLDAVLGESHSSPLRVSENPIESGSQIADNAILMPRPFEVTGVMVDYNPDDTPFNKVADEYKIRDSGFIDDVPVPASLKSITNQTVEYVNRSVDLVASTASQLVGGQTGQRALAQWLPNLLPVDVSDLSISDKRVADAYAALRNIQKSAIPVQIITNTTTYDSVLITDVRVRVVKDGSAVFTLPCKEVFIVGTQTVGGVSVATTSTGSGSGKTSGRTAAQTSTQKNKGQVAQKPVAPGSVDSDYLDQAKAVVGR